MFRSRREMEPQFETIGNRVNSAYHGSTHNETRDLVFEHKWGVKGREVVYRTKLNHLACSNTGCVIYFNVIY